GQLSVRRSSSYTLSLPPIYGKRSLTRLVKPSIVSPNLSGEVRFNKCHRILIATSCFPCLDCSDQSLFETNRGFPTEFLGDLRVVQHQVSWILHRRPLWIAWRIRPKCNSPLEFGHFGEHFCQF